MKNEIKRLSMSTRIASFVALTMAAFAVVSTTGIATSAQGQNLERGKPDSTTGDLFWSTDLNSALAQAKGKNKYVLADMYTDWCTWCKVLDRKTFADPTMMSYLNKKYICVRINAENPNGGKEAAEKYKVYEFPCVLVFEPNGKFLGKIMGFQRPEIYQKTLENLLKNPQRDPYAGI